MDEITQVKTLIFILTADEVCREYCASRSREAAYFLMRLCASCYTERQISLTLRITAGE